MKKNGFVKIVAWFMIGGIFGCGISYFVLASFSATFFEDASVLKNAVDIQQNVYVLQKIKEEKIDSGVELLEINLDGNIIGLMGVGKNEYSVLTNKAVAKAIYCNAPH